MGIQVVIEVEKKVLASGLTVCAHCGNDCPDHNFAYQEKYFCCQGCETVYQILSSNELCEFYSIDQKPGATRINARTGDYSHLDLPEISHQILEYQDAEKARVSFHLPEMHCSSCIWLLEQLYKINPAITVSQVDFGAKKITLLYKSQEVSLRQIAELLDKLGYPPDIRTEADQLGNKAANNVNRRLVMQIGITGFCFGNIMLFSFPEYLSLWDAPEESATRLFSLLNIILSLPVLFFGGFDYLKAGWKAIVNRQVNIDVPIAIGIIALFSWSIWEIVSQLGSGYLDSMAGLIFFLLIGKWFQQRTYDFLSFDRDYRSFFPLAVKRKTETGEENVPIEQVVPGDILFIRNQDLIPADSLLLMGNAMVDYSFVTGEAMPVRASIGDLLYAGGKQTGGEITVQVQKAVSNSHLTSLWNRDIFRKKDEERFSVLIDRISRNFTFVVLGIATLSLVGWWVAAGLHTALYVFATILIVACPCALALTAPFTYGNSLRLLAKAGLYLKNGTVIEKMAAVDNIVLDKTGTLTVNDDSEVSYYGITIENADAAALAAVVKNSAHPLSRSIAKAYVAKPDTLVEEFKEYPGEGVYGIANSVELIIGSRNLLHRYQVTVLHPVTNGSTKSYLAINGQFFGSFLFSNRYREGIEHTLQQLSSQYQLTLLSGDSDAEEQKLKPLLGNTSTLLFNQSPADKMANLAVIQQQGHHVLMLGDGLNDAGALKQSEVGIAVADNINQFFPASDGMLHAQHINKLPQFLQFSKDNITIIRSCLVISLAYNVTGISIAVAGLLTPLIAAILMPLSSISVVLAVTLATNVMARKRGITIKS